MILCYTSLSSGISVAIPYRCFNQIVDNKYCHSYTSYNFRQTVIRAMEKRESQNTISTQRPGQAQGNCQRIIRTSSGTIIATNVDSSMMRTQTATRTTPTAMPQNRPSITTTARIHQPGYRPQVQRNVTYQTSPAREAWLRYMKVRCCLLIVVVIIVAIAAGVGGSRHKANSYSWSDIIPTRYIPRAPVQVCKITRTLPHDTFYSLIPKDAIF